MTKSRGVRGAAGGCAVASLVYLLVRGLLTLLVSALMGLAHPGASLAKPLGFSGVSTALFQLLIGLGAIVLTLVFLLKVTRLKTKDLRIMLPAPWSPGFCLPVFLGVANLANLAGALINRLTGSPATSEMLPSGGPELLVQFLALCVMPAIAEELLFRGAFQGLMRPCGSAAAIFAPALLFGVLHLDLAQGLTAFACGVFLGWLAERSGSILPGMLLHLVNNALAFLTIYLRYYAPAEVSFGVELFILLFFPAFGAWMICNARRQGFSFSAGLRPGVDVLTVFTSPVYCATVLFLVAYAAIFVHCGDSMTDEELMRAALDEAKIAADLGEVPVGAVVAKDGEIVARAHNLRESGKNATYQAELMAIDAACKALGGWRLWQCELFVTLEPCPMCSGAIINSRLKRVVYGARDPKAGCCGSLTDLFALPFNHHPVIESGLLEDEAQALLQDFFVMLREKRKKK